MRLPEIGITRQFYKSALKALSCYNAFQKYVDKVRVQTVLRTVSVWQNFYEGLYSHNWGRFVHVHAYLFAK